MNSAITITIEFANSDWNETAVAEAMPQLPDDAGETWYSWTEVSIDREGNEYEPDGVELDSRRRELESALHDAYIEFERVTVEAS